MNEIKLLVEDENLETVQLILDSLKSGLIESTVVNAKVSKLKTTQYKPCTNKIIKEEDSGTNDSNGKYINPAAYKQRLKKKQ